MPASKKKVDYETAIARLEEITDLLESGESTLEESIALYTEGLELAKLCDDRLNEAEKKIAIIREKSGAFEEEDFSTGDA
jgi:exodeoxyribonuclease VII small subunit